MIDLDGEHVRVVNDAVLDGEPSLAAVFSLPRQMPRTGVDVIGVARIDGDRFNVAYVRVSIGRQLRPTIARIFRDEDAVMRTCGEEVWIGRRLRKREDRLGLQLVGLTPSLPAVG